ncbi:TIM-barrel domain-containing protein [Virgibacillus dakarensis]|uniref:TIM-barrel domain-containing protein n=1 Tax=Virgibacillus dakarensis TaxID=1917889 RepID=UPI000B45163C|nr:TIM-barrel domain-containing protein [Virgibacillus dakarensis]
MKNYLKVFVFSAVLMFALTIITPDSSAKAEKQDETVIGDLTDFAAEENTYTLSAGDAKVRVKFYKDDMFRIWLAQDGKFTDPAGDEIIVKNEFPELTTDWSDEGDYYRVNTKDVTLRIYKKPLRFELYESDNKTLVWKETKGLSWNGEETKQTLSRDEKEQFFGGGMQNGRFTHRDETIEISRSTNWEDGGHPNAAPFYMSTNGYGVFRNTFAPGSYSYKDPVVTTHKENRFDSFYFYGPGLKEILDGYTELTGRPFMPPLYGLEPGDADCYNDEGQTTLDALEVADGYKENDMPAGWMLVNDGYGCGYEDLEQVGTELRDRNIEMGLWTEDGLPNQEFEVNKAGVRVRKLDVAWVGPGYQFALDAAQEAYEGIEQYSDARGFVWMVEGWSGAQRYAVQWTGDQSGSWENIRFHIPTIAGSGMSGQAFTTGDIDGIFGGSPETYVRDLQWKAFNPVLMSMSGWAETDKQPWRYGEPYTSINRKYLKLRQQLLPYIYTYAAEAHQSGVPLARSMVLEYPDDPVTWDTTTQYQYLFGESLLVAPVFEDTDKRDGIYLPKGKWIDYWSGEVYNGPRMVNDYQAPLEKLPLFVKAGAIVPMWPENNSYKELANDHPLIVDIYPEGKNSFTLYEDDGVTRAYQEGAFAEQKITTDAPENGSGNIEITVGASKGEYEGKPEHRPYEFTIHTSKKPANVGIGKGKKLKQYESKNEFSEASEGWYYDEADRNGVVHVKTASMATNKSFTMTVYGSSSVGEGEGDPAALLQLDVPDEIEAGNSFDVTASFLNGSTKKMNDVQLSLNLPEGWKANGATDATFDKVDTGQEVTATFSVTPPEDTEEANYDISAQSTFKQTGSDYSVNANADIFVTDPYKIKQSEMTATATSEQSGSDSAEHAIDGKKSTMWHTDWSGNDKLPQSITLDLGGTHEISEVTYLPRQSGTNGIITDYKLYVSTDGENFTEIASGKWNNDKTEKRIGFDPIEATHIKLEAIEGVGGFASAAELNVFVAKQQDVSISSMLETLNNHREDVVSEDAYRLLETHLKAVRRYESQEKAKKIVKHMEGFKDLLEHQHKEKLISDNVFAILRDQTGKLIKHWK